MDAANSATVRLDYLAPVVVDMTVSTAGSTRFGKALTITETIANLTAFDWLDFTWRLKDVVGGSDAGLALETQASPFASWTLSEDGTKLTAADGRLRIGESMTVTYAVSGLSGAASFTVEQKDMVAAPVPEPAMAVGLFSLAMALGIGAGRRRRREG